MIRMLSGREVPACLPPRTRSRGWCRRRGTIRASVFSVSFSAPSVGASQRPSPPGTSAFCLCCSRRPGTATDRQLRGEPVHRRHGTTPFGRRHPLNLGHVANRITLTTDSSIMLAVRRPGSIRMRWPPTFRPVRYCRSPLPDEALDAVAGWPGSATRPRAGARPRPSTSGPASSRSMASASRAFPSRLPQAGS